jgi:hypothetical protein
VAIRTPARRRRSCARRRRIIEARPAVRRFFQAEGPGNKRRRNFCNHSCQTLPTVVIHCASSLLPRRPQRCFSIARGSGPTARSIPAQGDALGLRSELPQALNGRAIIPRCRISVPERYEKGAGLPGLGCAGFNESEGSVEKVLNGDTHSTETEPGY